MHMLVLLDVHAGTGKEGGQVISGAANGLPTMLHKTLPVTRVASDQGGTRAKVERCPNFRDPVIIIALKRNPFPP